MSTTDAPTILLETSELLKFKLGILDADKTAKYEYDLAKSELEHLLLTLEGLPTSDSVKSNIEVLKTNRTNAQKQLSQNPNTQGFIDAKDCLEHQLENIRKFTDAQAKAFVESRNAKDADNALQRTIIEAKMRRESLLRIHANKESAFLTEVGKDLLGLIPEANTRFQASLDEVERSKPDWEAALGEAPTQPELAIKKIERSIAYIQAGIERMDQARTCYNDAVRKMHKSDKKGFLFDTMDVLLKDLDASMYFTMVEKSEMKARIASVQLNAFKKTSDEDIAKVQANLQQISIDFTNTQEKRKQEHSVLESKINSLEERFKKVLLYTEAKTLAPVGQGLRSAKEQLGMWEITTANATLDSVEGLLKTIEADTENLERKAQWDSKMESLLTPAEGKQDPAIVEKLQRLMDASKTNAALTGVSEQATALNVQYTTLINQAFFEPEKFSEYLDEIQEIESKIATLEKSYAETANIEVDLNNHEASKQQALDKINAALDLLSADIPEVLKPALAQVRKPFESERDRLVQVWDKLCWSGLNKETVATLQGVLFEMDALEKNILNEVESYKGAENTLTPEYEILLGKQIQTEIQEIKVQCDNITDELLMFGFTPATVAEKLANDASMDSTPAVLTPIKEQIQQQRDFLKGQLSNKKSQFTKRQKDAIALYGRIDMAISGLMLDVEEYESSWKFWQPSKKEFKKLADVIQTELHGLESAIQSDVEIVFSEGEKALPELQTLIEQARMDFDGIENPKSKDASLTQLHAAVATLKEKIDGDTALKERNDNQRKEFLSGIEDIEGKIGEVLPRKLYEKLTSLEQDYQKEADIARDEVQRLEAFTPRYEATLKLLENEQSKAFNDHGEYYAKLLGGLKQAKGTAGAHGMMTQAESLLQQYATEINMVLNDGAKLTAKSTQVHDASEKNKAMQVEWEAKIDAFNREEFQRLKDAISAKQSVGDAIQAFFWTPEQLAEVETLREQSSEAAKKGDFEMALFRLADAKSRAQYHLDFPDGSTTKQLAEIQEVKKIWRAAVDAYQTDLDNVCSSIHSYLVDAGESASATKIKTVQSQLEALFAKPVFDGCVNILGKDGVDGKTARKYVKDGLAEVRRLRDLLTDGRIVQLHKHPFKSAPTFKGHYHIGKTLTDIEKTFLMANGRD